MQMNIRLGMFIVYLFVNALLAPCSQGGNAGIIPLRSGVQVGRMAALKELTQNYVSVTDKILKDLKKAKNSYSDDNTYMSPLHSAILAVQVWKVVTAEDVLLDMVDYGVDPWSVPDGMCLSGSAFYPAADALVGLRVDCSKVIRSISATSSKKRQFVLAWLLVERAGDCVTAQTKLSSAVKKFHGVSERKNIQATIKILESSSNLLGDAMEMANQDKK